MRTLKLIFLLLIPIVILIYFGFVWGVGCGLGSGRDFPCRIVLPSIGFSFIPASIASLVLIYSSLRNSTNETEARITYYANLIFYAIFIISLSLPITLIIIYSSLSEEQRLTYLEGYTPEACAAGKSLLPWSIDFSPDRCYVTLGMCDKVKRSNYQVQCYLDGQGNPKPDKIKNSSECSILKDAFYKTKCEQFFASKTQD